MENRNAARVLSTPPRTDTFLNVRLHEPDSYWKTLRIEDLIRFFSNPAKFFLRERLGVELTEPEAQLEDREPFEVDPLSGFKLGSRWLETLKSEASAKAFFAIHRQQGLLPHGGVGVAMVEGIQAKAETVWDAVKPLLKAPTPAEPFIIGIDEFTLTGTIPELYQGALVAYDYGKLNAKRLLRTWFHHLACGAARVDGWSGETHFFCRDAAVHFNKVKDPMQVLRTLLSIYWEGLQTPVWFFPGLSHVAAKALSANESPSNVDEKIKALCRKDNFRSEEVNDPYICKCFGSLKAFDPTFIDVAEKVFAPMLRSVETTSL